MDILDTESNKSGMNEEYHLTEMTIKGKPVQIYDNFLDTKLFKPMQEILLGPNFNWVYTDKITVEKYNGIKQLDNVDVVRHQDDDTFQFTHLFFVGPSQTQWSPLSVKINSILNAINPRAWTRIKANLGTRDPEHTMGGWHSDAKIGTSSTNLTTAIFYMNTNNGYTLLETEEKIESVENRLVVFPCDMLHTGVAQTDTKIKVTINLNFFI